MLQAQPPASEPRPRRQCDEALPLHKLVKIWRNLPERDRYGFILSLDEAIADELITATAKALRKEPTLPLTTEQAAEQARNMTTQQLENAVDRVGASPDATALGVQAAHEKARRAEQAQIAARIAEPVEHARRQARAVWEQAGSPGDFDTFFAEHQRQDAHAQIDRTRAAARMQTKF